MLSHLQFDLVRCIVGYNTPDFNTMSGSHYRYNTFITKHGATKSHAKRGHRVFRGQDFGALHDV